MAEKAKVKVLRINPQYLRDKRNPNKRRKRAGWTVVPGRKKEK